MKRTLGELTKGQCGRIVSILAPGEMAGRLLEMGLLEGSRVEVLHEAPWSGDPLAVRVRGALIALRRNEANLILVDVSD